MRHADASTRELKTGQLIEKLAPGWSTSHPGLAHEFVHRWAARFDTQAEVKEVGDDTLYFTAGIEGLCLRSMNDVRCLLIGGDGDNAYQALQDFWYKHNSPYHLPFILALSEAAYVTAVSHFANDHCLILSGPRLRELFDCASPRQFLKEMLWQQIPKRTLSPYNILVPADGVTFFGREHELRRLLDEDFVSFAVAGPGRIGKTSLVTMYKKVKTRQRKAFAPRMHYISFYQSDATADGAAKFLAKQIESNRQAERITAGEIVNFLRYRSKYHGGPLDLILDEVDEVCHASVFKFLGEAARLGYCRLIMCGRGTLLKTTLSGNNPIEGRLDLIRLEPLREEHARTLLLKPLADLGFDVREPEPLVEQVLELSGRLPHHIQMFGMKLVELAMAEGANTIYPDFMEMLKGDLMVAQFFIRTIADIRDVPTRLVGLALLDEDDGRQISIPHVQAVAKQVGVLLNSEQANNVCLDLAINNVLAWERGSFRIANRGVVFFTRQNGYLSSAMEDAKKELAPAAKQ